MKERTLQQSAHQQLLLDQVTLQSLHEQLTAEYESLLREREGLKATQRDLRNELRDLKEHCTHQEEAQTLLEQEKEKLRIESQSLGNLRAEHSSLKVSSFYLYVWHRAKVTFKSFWLESCIL